MVVITDGSDAPLPEGLRPTDPGVVLCRTLVRSLPVAGASISVVGRSGDHSIIGASDQLAATLEAKQYELGEGPHWEALRTRLPAFDFDLRDRSRPRWPTFSADAERNGAQALFAFPLQLGTAVVGVADLYSRTAVVPWSDQIVEQTQRLVVAISAAAVRIATVSANAETDDLKPSVVELRREVHQAVGMVMVQLDCTSDTALALLRAHAFASDTPLDVLANEVIRRRIDFARL